MFLFNKFGSSSDLKKLKLPESSLSQRMVLLHENYQDKIQENIMDEILVLIRNNHSSTKVFRQLLKNIIPDESIWAKNNHESMIKEYPIINACIGNKFI